MEIWKTMWEATAALLDTWAERPAGHEPARIATDDVWAHWDAIVALVEDRFEDSQSGMLDEADNEWLDQILESQGSLPRWDVAHALAWGLDAIGWTSFTDDWLPAGQTRELMPGELYPISDVDRTVVGEELTPRPGSLGDDIEELPHVRRFRGAGRLTVVLDAQYSVRLRGALELLEKIVTVHPNVTLEEFEFPPGQPVHGIRPIDLVLQHRLLTDALEREMQDGALVVLPELSVTAALLEELTTIIDEGPTGCLVVSGSYHGVEGGEPVNLAFALLPELGQRLTHRKLVAMEGKHMREGIVEGSELRVWVAGPWRFAMAICKDAIALDTQDLLVRLGVNVLAVPAMTPKTDPFVGLAGRLATQAQGFVAVANNPGSMNGDRVISALFGQPIPDRTVLTFPAQAARVSAGRGTCTLVVGDGDVSWQPL